MITNNLIKNTFNKAHQSYDEHCDIQKHIGNQLLHFLTYHTATKMNIIDLGCGTGIVTEKLISTLTYTNFHAIDFADQMVAKTRIRLANHSINIYSADFDDLPMTTPKFDLIFSNMALHWSRSFLETLGDLTIKLNNEGIIAFSIPLPGTFKELQPHFSINSFIPVHPVIEALKTNSCKILTQYTEEIALPFNDTFSALKSIKQVGASTVVQDKSHYCKKSTLKEIKIQTLTYHVGYFIAQKSS